MVPIIPQGHTAAQGAEAGRPRGLAKPSWDSHSITAPACSQPSRLHGPTSREGAGLEWGGAGSYGGATLSHLVQAGQQLGVSISQFAQHLTRKWLKIGGLSVKGIYALQTLGRPKALTPHGASSLPLGDLSGCGVSGLHPRPAGFTTALRVCSEAASSFSVEQIRPLGRPASSCTLPPPCLGVALTQVVLRWGPAVTSVIYCEGVVRKLHLSCRRPLWGPSSEGARDVSA